MNCHLCSYHRTIPGDTHYSCACPKAEHINDKPLVQIMGMMAKRAGPEAALYFLIEAEKACVELNIHGVKNYWALWPISFDPIWITSCENFEKKE